MLRCAEVRSRMAWFGVVRMLRYGMAGCGIAQLGKAWFGKVK